MEEARSLKRIPPEDKDSKRIKTNENETILSSTGQNTVRNSIEPCQIIDSASSTPLDFLELSKLIKSTEPGKAVIKNFNTNSSDFFLSESNKAQNLKIETSAFPLSKRSEELIHNFDAQTRRKQDLIQKINEIKQEIQEKNKVCQKLKINSENKQEELKCEIKKIRRDKENKDKELQRDNDNFRKLIEFYKTLSGVSVEELGKGRFKVIVKYLQDEFVFALAEDGNTYNYELISTTIPESKVPSYLRTEINIDKEDAAVLLDKVLGSLH